MDNIELALNWEDDDGCDDFYHDCTPYHPSGNPLNKYDKLNELQMNKMLRYHGANTVGEGIMRQIMDEHPELNVVEVKFSNKTPPTTKSVSRDTGINGTPYVHVDFKWNSAGKELDPNYMETTHILNTIKYIKRLVDEGKKSELEGDRIIRGFNKILSGRQTETSKVDINESEAYKCIKGMEKPVISILDKSTGEIIEIDTIPFSIILDLAKKYGQ